MKRMRRRGCGAARDVECQVAHATGALQRGLNMQLSAEIFNLLNDGTYEVYNPDSENGFQVNGIDQARTEFGRQWQLGMRLSF